MHGLVSWRVLFAENKQTNKQTTKQTNKQPNKQTISPSFAGKNQAKKKVM
jgi:hypothetical protein